MPMLPLTFGLFIILYSEIGSCVCVSHYPYSYHLCGI
jgi:hypothetical protein